jgi:N-acyl-D-amino-acid deacylase
MARARAMGQLPPPDRKGEFMNKRPMFVAAAAAFLASSAMAQAPETYDLLIDNGTIYDGMGGAPFTGDVAIRGNKIVYVGPEATGTAKKTINAAGIAVSPGFINMLSWANESLIHDGRGLSDTVQGVTLEVFGEGQSMGPWNAAMKRNELRRQGDIKYPIRWTTLWQYLDYLQRRGVTPNVASFIGAATVRIHELGEGDVDPTPEQLTRMRALVRDAMKEGALGVGSSLIYAPAYYAETPELIAITEEAAKCGGMYISHMRNEGLGLLEAMDELIEISRKSGAPAEIYHFKQAGKVNWDKLDAAIAKVNAARSEGLRITADMYTYPAGATGLDAAMPVWVQAGGLEEWIKRLKDPATREKVKREMLNPDAEWENLLQLAGGADKAILVSFKNPKLKPLTGKTLAEVAQMRGKSPEETAMDLVIEDNSRVGTVYFLMSEDNVRKQVGLPWMSFGSDAESAAPEGVFLKSSTHPRAYGNFSRLLGKYVRDEKAATMADAIRRITSFPATNLGIKGRGVLREGYYADVVLFDPAKIQDHATFQKPQQLSTGVRDVFVNGVQVLADGKHTGAKPGRAVRGPGWTGWPGGGACK